MLLSVRELLLKNARFSETIPPGTIEWNLTDEDPQVRQLNPLVAEGDALIHEATEEIEVRGKLAVELELECSRCLSPVRTTIEESFDLAYSPAPKSNPGQEIELHGADIDLGFYSGPGIELTDVLREQVLLSLPMQTLCRPDCAGICPACGADRNQERCECREQMTDERWAALRKISM